MTQNTDKVPVTEALYKTILDALQNYTPTMQVPSDPDDNFNLHDLLTPEWDETITAGVKEVENLADYIVGEINASPDLTALIKRFEDQDKLLRAISAQCKPLALLPAPLQRRIDAEIGG